MFALERIDAVRCLSPPQLIWMMCNKKLLVVTIKMHNNHLRGCLCGFFLVTTSKLGSTYTSRRVTSHASETTATQQHIPAVGMMAGIGDDGDLESSPPLLPNPPLRKQRSQDKETGKGSEGWCAYSHTQPTNALLMAALTFLLVLGLQAWGSTVAWRGVTGVL